MLTSILTYLAAHKVILVGATATVCEMLVIVVNTYRKLKAKKSAAFGKSSRESTAKILAWSANPLNLFKKA